MKNIENENRKSAKDSLLVAFVIACVFMMGFLVVKGFLNDNEQNEREAELAALAAKMAEEDALSQEDTTPWMFEGIISNEVDPVVYDHLESISEPEIVRLDDMVTHMGSRHSMFNLQHVVGIDVNNIMSSVTVSFNFGTPEGLSGEPVITYQVEDQGAYKQIVYKVRVGLLYKKYIIYFNPMQ